MKQLLSGTTPFTRTALLFALTLLLASCGGSIPAQPNPTPTTMPTPTNPSQPMDDVRGPLPIPTADSAGPTPTIIGPIVGTSVAGGPVEGPPLTSIVTPTPHPTLLPGPDGVVLLKTVDRPTAAIMSVGNTLRLELEDFYDWTIGVSDPSILTLESDGTYRAAGPGITTLELQGDPKCLKAVPSCGAPSIGLTVTITVK